jgi:hypothetical protein
MDLYQQGVNIDRLRKECGVFEASEDDPVRRIAGQQNYRNIRSEPLSDFADNLQAGFATAQMKIRDQKIR